MRAYRWAAVVMVAAWAVFGLTGSAQAADPKIAGWVELLGVLAPDDPQRAQIAGQAASEYFASADKTLSVPLAQWAALCRQLKSVLNDQDRQTWLTRIQSAYAGTDPALGGLSEADLRSLVSVAGTLGTPEAGADLAWKWVKLKVAAGGTPSVNVAGVTILGLKSRLDDRAAKLKLVKALDQKWAEANAASPLDLGQCRAIVGLWWELSDIGKVQEWAKRAYDNTLGTEALRAAATTETLEAVSRLLTHADLNDEGHGYTGYAQVLGRLAVANRLGGADGYHLARPLNTPEARQTFQAALLDAQGNPRPDVARVLSYAYKLAGGAEFDKWKSYVDQQAAAAAAGDRKALWYVARGHVGQHIGKTVLSRKQWLDRAIAEAESEPVRVLALRALMSVYSAAKAPAAGASVLESVKGQFTGDHFIQLAALQAELQEAAQRQVADRVRRSVQAESVRKKALLGYYQRRAKVAQTNGDRSLADRLQGLAASLEGELGR